jgi:hypothetical protein
LTHRNKTELDARINVGREAHQQIDLPACSDAEKSIMGSQRAWFCLGGSEAISKKLIDGDGRRVFKVQRGFLLVARYTPISFVWDTN